MKKNKLRDKIIINFILISSIAIFVMGYTHINKKYPEAILKEYKLNEEVAIGNLQVKAKNCKFLSKNDLEKMELPTETIYADEDMKAFFIEVTVKNTGDKEEHLELSNFNATSLSWRNGINVELYISANKEPKLNVSLKPGEERSQILTFSMIESQFRKKTWENIEKVPFSLVITEYPVRNTIKLN